MKRSVLVVTMLIALLAGAPVASAAGGLSGTYKTKIGSGQLAGAWTIKFSHGNYKVTQDGAVVVRGKYTVSGSKLSMKDTGGPAACSPTGRYTFTRSGNKLKFANTGDRSATCATVLSHTFTKA